MFDQKDTQKMEEEEMTSGFDEVSVFDTSETDSLDTLAASIRKSAIEERSDNRLKDVDVWFSHPDLQIATPDRVRIISTDNFFKLLESFSTHGKELIDGTIYLLDLELVSHFLSLCEMAGFTAGYVTDADMIDDAWQKKIADVTVIDTLSIPDLFEPLHIPDAKLRAASVPAPSSDDVEEDVREGKEPRRIKGGLR
jgi:hypothetical protein